MLLSGVEPRDALPLSYRRLVGAKANELKYVFLCFSSAMASALTTFLKQVGLTIKVSYVTFQGQAIVSLECNFSGFSSFL